MNEIDKGTFQFDYYNSNYHQFESDFYKYSELNIPLTFLVDDILYSMIKTQRNYFRLNASNAVDHRDHYFYFLVEPLKDNPQLYHYTYTGHRTYKYPKNTKGEDRTFYL